MDLRALHYFITVVDCGSLTAASAKLRISQPALGLQIKKLEAEFQTQLVIRHPRGVEPTEAGRLLLERARDILKRVDGAAVELREFAAEPRGMISLGMSPSTCAVLAAPLLQRLSAEAPHIRLNIVEELSAMLMEWVANDRLDLALAYLLADIKGLRWEPLLREDLYFVEGAKPGRTNGGSIGFREAARSELIMTVMSQRHRSILEETARAQGVRLSVLYEMQSIATLRDLVGRGLGATILPYSAVARDVDAGLLVAKRIVDPELTRDVCFIYSERRPLSRAAQVVRAIIVDLIRDQVGSASGNWRPIEGRSEAMSRVNRFIGIGEGAAGHSPGTMPDVIGKALVR